MIIKSKLTRIRGINDVYIYPGSNHIPDEKIEELMGHEDFKLHFEIGDFSIIDTSSNSKKNEDENYDNISDEIGNINSKDAVKIIKDIYIVDQLNQIIENDHRKSVKNAAEKQIDMLKQGE